MAKKKNIRGKYIQSLMEDKERYEKNLKESTDAAVHAMLGDVVKETFKSIINEGVDNENAYTVETVKECGSACSGGSKDKLAECGDDISKYINEDGDLDLSGLDTDTAVDIVSKAGINDKEFFKVIKTADGIEVSDDEGNTVTANMSDIENAEEGETVETSTEEGASDEEPKVIDDTEDENGETVDNEDNGETCDGETCDDSEDEYSIELDDKVTDDEGDSDTDDISMSLDEVEDYFTNTYQKDTAMTTPNDKEPGKNVNIWDKGVNMGTERQYGKSKGKSDPFTDIIKEAIAALSDEAKAELDEEGDELTNMPTAEQPTLDEYTGHTSSSPFKNADVDGRGMEGRTTMHNKVMAGKKEVVSEAKRYNNLVAKANAIIAENKELRKIAKGLKALVNEAQVVNSAYASIIRILTENATNSDEKKNIITRFSKVNDLNECKKLYETISEELASTRTYTTANTLINKQQVFESKQADPQAVLTESVNKSKEVADMRSLVKRVMAIK